MTTLTIMPANVSVEVAAGTNLLQAILDAGQALVTKCGGKASCGGCHIFLTGGRKGISKMTPEENAKLDTIVGIGSKSRLAPAGKIEAIRLSNRRAADAQGHFNHYSASERARLLKGKRV